MSAEENWKIGNEIGGGRLAITRKIAAILNTKDAEIARLRKALAIIGADHMLTGITTAKQKIMWDTARAALGVDQQSTQQEK